MFPARAPTPAKCHSEAILAKCGTYTYPPLRRLRLALCIMKQAPVAFQYGHVKVFVNDTSALSATINIFQSILPNAALAIPNQSDFFGRSANHVLSDRNAKFGLEGKAANNLGTALRVSAVRSTLDSQLLRNIGYLAATADMLSHLTTIFGIARTCDELHALCIQADVCP